MITEWMPEPEGLTVREPRAPRCIHARPINGRLVQTIDRNLVDDHGVMFDECYLCGKVYVIGWISPDERRCLPYEPAPR